MRIIFLIWKKASIYYASSHSWEWEVYFLTFVSMGNFLKYLGAIFGYQIVIIEMTGRERRKYFRGHR